MLMWLAANCRNMANWPAGFVTNALSDMALGVYLSFGAGYPSTTRRAHPERNAVKSKDARRSAQDASLPQLEMHRGVRLTLTT